MIKYWAPRLGCPPMMRDYSPTWLKRFVDRVLSVQASNSIFLEMPLLYLRAPEHPLIRKFVMEALVSNYDVDTMVIAARDGWQHTLVDTRQSGSARVGLRYPRAGRGGLSSACTLEALLEHRCQRRTGYSSFAVPCDKRKRPRSTKKL